MTPFPTPVTTGNGRSSHHTQESAYELFHNRDGNAFVDIYVLGHRETQMAQIRRDHQLCKLLVGYETESEIIGMMELVLDLKMKSSRRGIS